jgi:hypothetical protein
MHHRGRGLYEVLITEALQAELLSLSEPLNDVGHTGELPRAITWKPQYWSPGNRFTAAVA